MVNLQFSSSDTGSSKSQMDEAIATLVTRKQVWADFPIEGRIDLLRQVLDLTKEIADEWALADVKGRCLAEASFNAGLSYMQPAFALRFIRLYLNALEDIQKYGRPQYTHAPQVLPNGQTTLQVFPETIKEKFLYYGVKSTIWFEPEVRPPELPHLQAQQYRSAKREGRVCLVLGAGNYSLLTISDTLYKLINEIQVVLIKIHPLTAFIAPIIEYSFRPFIQAGFLRLAYGGAEEGQYLTNHPDIDEVHLTGSDKTFEAIVFGTGEEGAENKRQRRVKLNKRVTGELGNVTPVIIVPGPWRDQEVKFQVENIFTNMTPNNGFTCVANRVLIQLENWSKRGLFNQTLTALFSRIPPEKAYYPGTEQRIREAIKAHPNSQVIGEFTKEKVPWVFASGLKAEEPHPVFQQEIFGPFYAETVLSAPTTAAFIDQAVDLCNEKLWGSLSVNLIVHPTSLKDPEIKRAIDRAIAHLRYGSIEINTPTGFNFFMGRSGWGGYPNSTYYDVQSGMGWVNNTLMFDRIQKTVSQGSFFLPIKPPQFVTASEGINFAKAYLNYEKSPSWLNWLKIVWVVLHNH